MMTGFLSRTRICLAAILLASPAAFAEEPPAVDPSDDRLPDAVEDFFSRAVDEGLLPPADPNAVERQPFVCPDEQSLDLSEMRDIERYSQLVAFRSGMRGRDGAGPARGPASAFDEAKAHLSLGLYSELLSKADGQTDPGWLALLAVAEFMSADGANEVVTLGRLGRCSASGEFWASVQGLLHDTPGSVGVFSEHVAEFRSLPFSLRVDVAALVAPVLVESGHAVLANVLMATFDQEDLYNSASLRFLEAELSLLSRAAGSVDTVKEHLRHPQFRDEAISLLARSQSPLSTAQIDILQSDLASQFSELRTDEERLALAEFWISQARRDGDLALFDELLGVQALSDPISMAKLQRGLSDHISEKLASGDTSEALPILSALVADGRIAEVARSDAGVAEAAIAFASRNGMPTLAEHFAGSVPVLDEREDLLPARIMRAEWALAAGEFDVVQDLAGLPPVSNELNSLAIKASLRESDGRALSTFLSSANPSPAEALVWIEEDALHGAFLLPDDIWVRARQVNEPELQRRLEIVEQLRTTNVSALGNVSQTRSLADADEQLASVPDSTEGGG